MSEFKPFGPFEIPKKGGDRIDDKAGVKKFWSEIKKEHPGLNTARGCYIFAARTPKRQLKPWYVGQASKGFEQEVFQPHKLMHYNDVINNTILIPYMFLLAQVTPTGRFARTVIDKEIDYVEIFLIQESLKNNSALRNTLLAKMIEQLNIPGIFGDTKKINRTPAEKDLQKLFGAR